MVPGPKGSKVRSLKRRVQSHLARWGTKSHQRWTTFGKKTKPRRAKDTILRPVSEIEMSKKCTALWRRARRLKHHMFGPLLDVQMSFCVASARDPAPGQKSENRDALVAGFTYNHQYPYTTLRYTTLQHYTTPHQLQLHSTLHSTLYTLHYTLKKICNHFIHSRRHSRQLQPPLNESVDSPFHPWFTATKLSYRSYRFTSLKVPPPPCAVLLVRS